MKRLLSICIGLTLLSGCLNFGGEVNSKVDSLEARQSLSALLGKDLPKELTNVHFLANEIGIDPFYFFKFECGSEFVKTIVENGGWTPATKTMAKPSHSPDWYKPDLSSTFLIYGKDGPGKMERLSYDSNNGIAYYQHSSY